MALSERDIDAILEEQDELRLAIGAQIEVREEHASRLFDIAAHSRETIARTPLDDHAIEGTE
jgi:hypothetical protein